MRRAGKFHTAPGRPRHDCLLGRVDALGDAERHTRRWYATALIVAEPMGEVARHRYRRAVRPRLRPGHRSGDPVRSADMVCIGRYPDPDGTDNEQTEKKHKLSHRTSSRSGCAEEGIRGRAEGISDFELRREVVIRRRPRRRRVWLGCCHRGEGQSWREYRPAGWTPPALDGRRGSCRVRCEFCRC